jgi:hypothetical protein
MSTRKILIECKIEALEGVKGYIEKTIKVLKDMLAEEEL